MSNLRKYDDRTYGEGRCEGCGEMFTKNSPNQKKCTECRKPRKGTAHKYKDKKCSMCGNMFTPSSGIQKYCRDCKVIADRERDYEIKHRTGVIGGFKARICDLCGVEYEPTGNAQRYCQDCCLQMKGIRRGVGYSTGEHRVQEKFKSDWEVQKSTYRRFALDNLKHVCVNCGETEVSKLAVHHIDENKSNNKLSNLQILCRSCHLNHHKRIRWLVEDAQKCAEVKSLS